MSPRTARSIPAHTLGGVLPPFDGDDPARSGSLAPYRVLLAEVVLRLSSSPARVKILQGYLRHRAVLRQAGLNAGFQWFGGSFIDQMARDPGDLDVVTFFFRQPGWTARTVGELAKQYADAFSRSQAKDAYSCDAFFVDLSAPDQGELVALATYWYGLFSHQRHTQTWRGMLEVDLATDDDDREVLNTLNGLRAQ